MNVICNAQLLSRKEIKGLPHSFLPLDLFDKSEIINQKQIHREYIQPYLDFGRDSSLVEIMSSNYRKMRTSNVFNIFTFFSFTFLASKLRGCESIEFYFSKTYDLDQLFKLNWLFYLIENSLLHATKVDLYLVDQADIQKIDSLKKIQDLLFQTTKAKPTIESSIVDFSTPACLLHLPALRHPEYFLEKVIMPQVSKENQMLFVGDEIVRFSNFEKFNVVLENPATLEAILASFSNFSDNVKGINVFSHMKSVFDAYIEFYIERYYEIGYLKLLEKCAQTFDQIDISHAFSTEIENMESVALLQYLNQRNVTVDLLPHSFLTHPHLTPEKSYRKRYVFFSMQSLLKNSCPSNFDWKKEQVLPIPMSKEQKKRSKLRLRKSQAVDFLLYKLMKKIPDSVAEKYFSKVATKHWLASLPKKRGGKAYKIGVLFNWDMYEFMCEQSIKEIIKWALHVSTYLSQLSKRRVEIYFKPKPSYTRPHYFIQEVLEHAKNYSEASRVKILNPLTPIKQFAKSMNLIVFHQTTSAIVEILEHGTPCIRLKETKMTPIIYTDLDNFIEFPTNLVPSIALEDLSYDILRGSDSFIEIAQQQTNWFNSNKG